MQLCKLQPTITAGASESVAPFGAWLRLFQSINQKMLLNMKIYRRTAIAIVVVLTILLLPLFVLATFLRIIGSFYTSLSYICFLVMGDVKPEIRACIYDIKSTWKDILGVL